MTTRLEDTSPMPFGKHKGTPMQDVPARYLHWFYTEGYADSDEGKAVIDYIERSQPALMDEYPDGIWKRRI